MEGGVSMRDLTSRDQTLVWHPFTQHLIDPSPIPIARGEGTYLFSESGKKYIDANSSWWSNLHGHSHPYIAEKIAAQARTLEHVMFADFTHEPAVSLAERLHKILPSGLSRFFYSDNGSTAVEAAIKIALQYWHNDLSDQPRKKIIAFEGSYHGDTFGAMSAAGRSRFNRPFWPFLFEVEHVPPPYYGEEDRSCERLLQILNEEDAACFIFEPIVQGAAGMVMHNPEGLDRLMNICRQRGVLLVADEVMTGFGRTGPLFASDLLKEKPDIVCLSKGLTGGSLPLALTVCREEIYERFLSSERIRAFLHGHTYTANPLGCAAALASLDLLLAPECEAKRKEIEESHVIFKQENAGSWKRCDVSGTILALEYPGDSARSYFSEIRSRLSKHFLDDGVIIRPIGNTVHVIPPYCIKQEDLAIVYNSLTESLQYS